MARRTGVYTLQYTAKTLCRFVSKFTPILTSLYPTNAALLAALAAANGACHTLFEELEKVRDKGD
jgi:hypothetical protein